MTVVAIAQFSPTDDKDENVRTIGQFARSAADAGAALLVAPEYSSFMTPTLDERIVACAEPLDGPFVRGVRLAAKEAGLAVVVGLNEAVPGERRIHNTLVFVDAAGDVVGTYRKLHLYDAFDARESNWIIPGEATAVTTMVVDGVTLAAQTCYDIRFPEVTRALVNAGAELVVVPAQWVPGAMKEDHWMTLLRARAIENTVYVAAADHSAPHGAGQSMVIDPMGVVVAALGERIGFATAVVERARIDEVRAKNPSLLARRFDVHVRPVVERVPVSGSAALPPAER